NHPFYPKCLFNIAKQYEELGDYDNALQFCEQALDLYKAVVTENRLDYANCLARSGRLRRAKGQPKIAVSLSQQALTIKKEFLDNTLGALSERQRLDILAQFKSTLHEYRSVAAETATPAGQLYETILAWKG